MKHWLSFIFIIAVTLIAQNDSIPDWLKADPKLRIEPDEILIEQFHVEEIAGSNIPYFFFEPESYQLDPAYNEILKSISIGLSRNPAAKLIVKGFYSRSIDDIPSPALSMELAKNRADAVSNSLVMNNPALSGRLIYPEGYDMSIPLLPDTSMLDLRATLEFSVPGFSSRSVLVQDYSPYIRTSYRDIINVILPELQNIMIRNPDVFIQIYAKGRPWDSPLWECYQRLERVGDYLDKKLPESARNRIAYYVDSGPATKSIDIRLHFSYLGASIDKWQRSPASHVAVNTKDVQILRSWNPELPLERTCLLLTSTMTGQKRGFAAKRYSVTDTTQPLPFSDTLTLTEQFLKESALPGVFDVAFTTKDTRDRVETGIRTMDFKLVCDSIEFRQRIDVAHYMPESMTPLIPKNVNLYRISSLISDYIADFKVPLSVKIVAPQDSHNPYSQLVADHLKAILIARNNLKEEEDLEKWLTKRGVTISQEFSEPIDKVFPAIAIELEAKGER